MIAPPPPDEVDLTERHLLALWRAIRDAADLLRRQGTPPGPAARVAQALAVDARRLAELIEANGPAPLRPLAAPSADGRMKVLLVDDDPCALLALEKLLARSFDVRTTTDPARVPHLVEEDRPDAVVTDLYMPELDGLALIALLRTTAGGAPPVLVTTAAVDVARHLEALEMGAFDCLTKPLDIPDLVARIHRAVRHARELDRQRRLQQTDGLTGLLNRRAFDEVIEAALGDRRTQGTLALVLIDEDGLKRLNDAFGHAAGDRAIVAIARTVERARRRSDFAARIGGDEFALVMPGADLAAAERVMARIADALGAAPLELGDGRQIGVGISWGIATAGGPDTTAAALFARADAALYAMKRGKRAA